jgi:transposase-like protein
MTMSSSPASTTASPTTTAPTEVSPKAKRRTFTTEYKRRILREADACKRPGEMGALLRREGLYSSHVTEWRAARDRGELAGKGSPYNRRNGSRATAIRRGLDLARNRRFAETDRRS